MALFSSSPAMRERLVLLNRQLRSRRQRLMSMRRESNERLADFAVADVSLFWLLNALNSHARVLTEFERFPARHPEQVWAELARLAGSMLTFSLDSDLDAIPGYDHAEPEKTFPPLFELITTLLEASLPSRVIALDMLRPDEQTWKTGDDPAYDDNFLLMREEINKLSGTDPDQLCALAEKILCESAKDIRVVTWYIQARLSRDGEKGLAEGLLLLAAMLSRYGKRCHPLRSNAMKAALEWLNSSKILDTLLRWPEVERDDASLTVGAVNLLAASVTDWPESEKPIFAGLCSALENRLARSGGMEALIAEKVDEDGLSFGSESVTPVTGVEDDVLLLEAEAMEKGDSEGPEAALAWLQSRPGMDTPRHRWLVRLLMARVAEQYGRNDMALLLLGELAALAPQLTLGDWEPGLLFEVQARRLKLLRMRAGRSESDKARLMPEMDALLAGLIAIDPVRSMVLCG